MNLKNTPMPRISYPQKENPEKKNVRKKKKFKISKLSRMITMIILSLKSIFLYLEKLRLGRKLLRLGQ